MSEDRDKSYVEKASAQSPGLSRGDFVKAVGGALVGGALLPIGSDVASAHGLARPRAGALRTLDHASLSALVGQRFYLYHGRSAAAVRLVGVTELKRQELPSGAHRTATAAESFSIVFRADRGLQLPQGTYTFRHRGLRTFKIFIVPASRTDRGQNYEATFHHLAR